MRHLYADRTLILIATLLVLASLLFAWVRSRDLVVVPSEDVSRAPGCLDGPGAVALAAGGCDSAAAGAALYPAGQEPAPETKRHDGLHCIFCQVLHLAGKALLLDTGPDPGTLLLASGESGAPVQVRVSDHRSAPHVPRAPPSCS